MNDLAPIDQDSIWRPSAALNPQRLEYLWGLAERVAIGTTVPETLRGERAASVFTPFEPGVIIANVFAVVEQADRWNVSPFALISAAAIVRGKLAFEGKVIAAVLEAQFGVKLHAYYRGNPGTDDYQIYLCDEELPDDILQELKPGYRHDRYKILDGSVGQWKTTGNGSPWRPATYADMLMYRGTRQWARVHRSAVILGVLADDEIETAALEHAAQAAVPIGQRFASAGSAGFSPSNVRALENNSQQPMDRVETNGGEVEETTGARSGAEVKATPTGRKADDKTTSTAPASAKLSPDGDGGSGSAASTQTNSQGDVDPGQSVAALTRDVFRRYVKIVARNASEESVGKATKKFVADENIGSLSETEKNLFATIRDQFVSGVVKGKVSVDTFLKEADGWIVQDVSEDAL